MGQQGRASRKPPHQLSYPADRGEGGRDKEREKVEQLFLSGSVSDTRKQNRRHGKRPFGFTKRAQSWGVLSKESLPAASSGRPFFFSRTRIVRASILPRDKLEQNSLGAKFQERFKER